MRRFGTNFFISCVSHLLCASTVVFIPCFCPYLQCCLSKKISTPFIRRSTQWMVRNTRHTSIWVLPSIPLAFWEPLSPVPVFDSSSGIATLHSCWLQCRKCVPRHTRTFRIDRSRVQSWLVRVSSRTSSRRESVASLFGGEMGRRAFVSNAIACPCTNGGCLFLGPPRWSSTPRSVACSSW